MGLFSFIKGSDKTKEAPKNSYDLKEDIKRRLTEFVLAYNNRIRGISISYSFGKFMPISVEINGEKYGEFEIYFWYSILENKMYYNYYVFTTNIDKEKYTYSLFVDMILDNGEHVRAFYAFHFNDNLYEIINSLLYHLYCVYSAILELKLHKEYEVIDNTGILNTIISAVNVRDEFVKKTIEELKKGENKQ